ncbi:MAG: Fatty acid hydroxylase superfamily protein [Planctomycetaceae bacterium]|nr:Fatty acid hydroxylase superfamily protein [Planctomycetaceae bacterium]
MPDSTIPDEHFESPKYFGTGWISGVLSIFFSSCGLLAVLCFHFPEYLTMVEIRGHYPLPIVRAILHLFLVTGFLLGVTSVCLRQNKLLGLMGAGLTLVAALLGGSRVTIDGELQTGPYLGLDWFVLNLIAYTVVFVPLERAFARLHEQPIFRYGWRTDLVYFFVSTLFVQVMTLITMKPAMVLFGWATSESLQEWVSSQPYVLQFFELLVLTDFMQYWLHRMFHQVPWLWQFHAVHHSSQSMDWIAGSRTHLVDQATTRAVTFIPLWLLGFADAPMFAYLVFVTFHGTFLHVNLRWDLGRWSWLFAWPRFHHWHHAIEREAIDKNFAVHLPLYDYLFGTYYLPGKQWPTGYGISGHPVPEGYFRQFVYPFRRKKPTTDSKS